MDGEEGWKKDSLEEFAYANSTYANCILISQ